MTYAPDADKSTGDAHRNAVFSTSGTLLLAAFAAIARYLE